MCPKVYIDGKLYDKEDAKISVYDHGLLYGDGVFEGIRSYGGKVFRLDAAPRPAVELGQGHPPGHPHDQASEMAEAIRRHAGRQRHPGRLHPRRRHPRRRHAGPGPQPTAPIRRSSSSPTTSALYPEELYRNGLEIVTASDDAQPSRRAQPADQVAQLPEQHPGQDRGHQAGCVEALMLNHKGEVAECTGDNIFLVRDGRLLTPPIVDSGILEGITRDAVIELARAAGHRRGRSRTLDRHDVYIADECFLTGTAAELIPVVEFDGRTIGDGPAGPDHPRSASAIPDPGPRGALTRRARRDRDPARSWPRPISATIRRRPSAMRAGSPSAWARSCTWCTSSPRSSPPGPDPLLMPVMPPEYYQENEDRARETLNRLLDPAWGTPRSVLTGGPMGKPGRSPSSPTRWTIAIDLIVIATHGRTGLSHVLLGSVAERIVREAPCPVLTIRDHHRGPATLHGDPASGQDVRGS